MNGTGDSLMVDIWGILWVHESFPTKADNGLTSHLSHMWFCVIMQQNNTLASHECRLLSFQFFVDTNQLFRVYSGMDCLASWQQFAMHDTPRSDSFGCLGTGS
jgi:hypothetical protein